MTEESSLSSWLKAYWPFLALAVGYLIQLVRVVNYQRTRLENPRTYKGAHLPLWKLALFLLPGVPLVYAFFELVLFDALIKVIIMTRQADLDLQKMREDRGSRDVEGPSTVRVETPEVEARPKPSTTEPAPKTPRQIQEEAIFAANPNLRRGPYPPYQP